MFFLLMGHLLAIVFIDVSIIKEATQLVVHRSFTFSCKVIVDHVFGL